VHDCYYDREKKGLVVCLAGARSLLRPERKKILVVCLAGCAVVSVFGSGEKSAYFLLWRESFITTGKKKFQSSGDYDQKKKSSPLFGGLCLRPEKKKFQSSV
jgi:hypothetical protein